MFLRNITSAIVAAIIPLVASAVEPTRYNLKVNDFTELKIVDDINVIYRNHPDSVGRVVFSATPDQASAFIFQPDGSKLEIQLAPEAASNPSGLPTVVAYSTYLTKAENDGKGHLKIESVAPGTDEH